MVILSVFSVFFWKLLSYLIPGQPTLHFHLGTKQQRACLVRPQK